jgi:hypothetical protein
MTFTTNTRNIVLITIQKANISMPAAHNAEHKKSTELYNTNQKNVELYNCNENSRTEERRIGTIRPWINFSKKIIAQEQSYTKGTVVFKKSKYQCSSTYVCPESSNGHRQLFYQHTKKTKLIKNQKEYYLMNKNLSPWILSSRKIATKSQNKRLTPPNQYKNTEKQNH